ncbi:zinc ribbon domain-containing protein [uncultured Sneathiella sp.]|uniref:Zn-ribbon domain-containing OB-fold protein n=1 Tax=uncultured Sneathiella sp. TaxID=879315 RepID=UPI002597A822|nr:zinc ribbon domain-containing protein [uncultured Sneathiella sp.]
MIGQMISDEIVEQNADGALRFVVGQCRDCGTQSFPAALICTGCQSDDLSRITVAADGVVYSLTEVHVGPPQWHRPTRLAYVDLDVGLRVFGHWRGDVCIGSAVRASIGEVGTTPEGEPLLTYVFELREMADA